MVTHFLLSAVLIVPTVMSDCSLQYGVDCVANDISSSPAGSPQECCNLCERTAGCGAFTHTQYDARGQRNPTCYLKAACTQKVPKGTAVAGIVQGPKPTPTPKAKCEAGFNVTFPAPTVARKQAPLTKEQAWMRQNWPGYANGVSLGGLFVIEDWMFQRTHGPYSASTLHLKQNQGYDNHAWSEELLKGDPLVAYEIMDCHLRKYYGDEELDQLAEFGINAVRLPVGYWLFDDPELYPNDTWVAKPVDASSYGVNPDGFVTPGTLALTDMVIKLWNRNIAVTLDMHALPGCSSPRQSYAGIHCEAGAPNYWNGLASQGISGGHRVQRSNDGKTWNDVGRKIALERVVPWIRFVNGLAPGAIVAYELVNEPDIGSSDASTEQVRQMTLELGRSVSACLAKTPPGQKSQSDVKIGISNAARNYPTSTIASDYKGQFSDMKDMYLTDIHHYYAWGGCDGPDYTCVCESALPGTSRTGEDGDWANYINSGVFEDGWRFYVGEWSAASNQGYLNHQRAQSMWQAQKWGYLSQYAHYMGKAEGGASSFLGDFYWSGRMGYNWDPSPGVCYGPTSTTDYLSYGSWDWSLIRLIQLGLARPLSELNLTPGTLAQQKGNMCRAATASVARLNRASVA